MLDILCLHGKSQCGEIFSQKIAALVKKTKKSLGDHVRFTFLDAPFVLPLREGQTVPMRSWNENDDWKKATQSVQNAFKKTAFDGIIAFSQGVYVACICCMSKELKASLKFIITAGGLASESIPLNSISIPSLHFIGRNDRCVLHSVSERMTACFVSPKVCFHERGHIVPQRSSEIQLYLEFIQDQFRIKGYDIIPEEQSDELEALEAIFEDHFEILHDGSDSRYPPTVRIHVFDTLSDVTSKPLIPLLRNMKLRASFLPRYPEKDIPHLELEDSKKLFLRLAAMRSKSRTKLDHSVDARNIQIECMENLRRNARENFLGDPMLFDLIEILREWILDLVSRIIENTENSGEDDVGLTEDAQGNGNENEMENDEEKEEEFFWWEREDTDVDEEIIHQAHTEAASRIEIFRPASQRGSWRNFTVGLVGKPSAGKSTFFNAVTSVLARDGREETSSIKAKVGAFPFTTIEPNVGFGFCSVPSLIQKRLNGVETKKIGTRYGRAENGERLLRIRVKDVAGLVPGAYKGKGHGNAFLNDLLDADVLVHMIDASGTSDRKGNSSGESKSEVGDPCEDITWVREEIHRWIFENLKSKWTAIRRRPQKLFKNMFTGYHCTTEYVEEVLKRTNLSLDKLPSWTALDLHRIVAHFLRIRFPILLALNKCDLANAAKHVSRVKSKFPHEPVSVLSARAECRLQELQRNKKVEYVTGSHSFVSSDKKLRVLSEFMNQHHGTGVLRTIDRAVSLRAPVFVYPVLSVKTCKSIEPLRDDLLFNCELMRPGSTVEDLYFVLKRDSVLKGDYVRGEIRDGNGEIRPVRKTDRIVDSSENLSQINNIISISVNKKVSWQKQASESSSRILKKSIAAPTNTTSTTSSKDRLMKRLLRGNKRQGKTKGGKGLGQL